MTDTPTLIRAPQPGIDREAVEQVLEAHKVGRHLPLSGALAGYRAVIADAVIDLARPMPTPDEIAVAIHRSVCMTSPHDLLCPGPQAIDYERAQAVLTLMGGAS